MIQNIETALIADIVGYLPNESVCRAARVSRDFYRVWNSKRFWAERFLALPYSRIARSLTVERFRVFHLATYFPRQVEHILTFLSSQETAMVALADRTLRFLVYTHPQIKLSARAWRERYLAIEYPNSLSQKMRQASDEAAKWLVWHRQHNPRFDGYVRDGATGIALMTTLGAALGCFLLRIHLFKNIPLVLPFLLPELVISVGSLALGFFMAQKMIHVAYSDVPVRLARKVAELKIFYKTPT